MGPRTYDAQVHCTVDACDFLIISPGTIISDRLGNRRGHECECADLGVEKTAPSVIDRHVQLPRA